MNVGPYTFDNEDNVQFSTVLRRRMETDDGPTLYTFDEGGMMMLAITTKRCEAIT